MKPRDPLCPHEKTTLNSEEFETTRSGDLEITWRVQHLYCEKCKRLFSRVTRADREAR